ncbi:MAG: 1-deoxy-D-xylulose-5-phosphate synthase [Acidimicrobiaceae bacterium]|nr:1-deoxy-D-xylulose-5-phosphate synthase [Acidimicrobiaceae bacterium]
MHIEKIKSPADLRALDQDQLEELCREIREFLVDAVSRTGGHLGSNLGAVELTIAVHRVFESPRDVILWDTGHQAYVHKLVTGRADMFSSLRQRHGLSGYPSNTESEHDIVENSHASTSLSWASGLSAGFDLTGHKHRQVVAVIGDGSMTGGMAFEALNNLGHYGQRAVIILNDNGRSYAPTVSRLATVMSRVRQSPNYVKGRQAVVNILDRMPLGEEVKRGLSGAAAAMREMWEPPAFFETLGVRYLGPIDGHDIEALESALSDASSYEDGPIVVHVLTDKGRGYAPAEDDEEKHLHDIGLFDPATGNSSSASGKNFTSEFSNSLLTIAERRPDVVAITAAMPGSTGLLPFQQRYPDRFFDTGIAEQHALTSAAGMARAGLRPFVAIYSTFLARGFDQVMYDIGLHGLPVVICIDRAGVTGPDGASHHGVHDIAMYARVPGMTIFSPSSLQELPVMMNQALETNGPVAIRWPRGTADESSVVGQGLSARLVRDGQDVAILAAGKMLKAATSAAELLAEEGVDAAVWDPRLLKPLDQEMIRAVIGQSLVVTVEDGSRMGGFGSLVADALQSRSGPIPRLLQLGIPDDYLPHGEAGELHAELGLDGAGIAAEIVKVHKSDDS